MQKLIDTFLALAAIDEVHPNENEVLAYIKKRLTAADVPFEQDKTGNIVGRITGKNAAALAFCGHTDIAAPLNGRKIVQADGVIKTDGTGLLGADDKAAVAVMLELADYLHETKQVPARTLELVFTVGEESGMVGAVNFDMSLITAKQMLVFDWSGPITEIITKSPAIYKLDVEYVGKDAHPAEWQEGKNAGAALIKAASGLQQGEYQPGVTFNIGIMQFGKARNQVPGQASLKAEMRSFDRALNDQAAAKIKAHFETVAKDLGVQANVNLDTSATNYQLDESGALLKDVRAALDSQSLTPKLLETYGGFDGNIFASRGIDVVILGAGYYHPHGPEEYLKIDEFTQMFEFLQALTTKP